MEISYLLIIITCFLYGFTGYIKKWYGFEAKLINSIAIIAIVVLTIITWEDGFFYYDDWINLLLPVPAVIIGYYLGRKINSDDWPKVCAVLAGLGLVATIITTCCGL